MSDESDETVPNCERVSYEQAICHDCGSTWDIPADLRDADEAIHKCSDEWRAIFR